MVIIGGLNGPTGSTSQVLYQLHELNRALLGPANELAKAGASMFSAPGSWLAQLPGAARVAAGYELVYRLGKGYEKPKFDIHSVEVDGAQVAGGRADRAGQAVLPPAAVQTLQRPGAGHRRR